jgi:hypothetical protein
MKKCQMLIAISVIVGSTFVHAGGEIGAKALFYNPNTSVASGVHEGVVQISPDADARTAKPSATAGRSQGGNNQNVAYSDQLSGYYDNLSNPGIQYWIELSRNGTSNLKRVTDRHIFKSGDKIRIHVAGNAPGQLHVLHKGSSGNQSVLPVSMASGNSIETGKDYVIPSDGGWLLFDNNKGAEELKFVFSTKGPNSRSPNLSPTPQPHELLAMYEQYSASKGLLQTVENGAKDLVPVGASGGYDVSINRKANHTMKLSDTIASAPGHYAVNTSGDPVAVTVFLRHQ